MKNRDSRIAGCITGGVITVGVIVGLQISMAAGALVLAVSFALLLTASVMYRKRNQKLLLLTEELDRMLHGDYTIRFADYKEGELAVLANELAKVTIRLKEQTEVLGKEKRALADSIADISHQIRTPLTSMNLLLTTAGAKELSVEEQRKKLFQAKQLTGRIEWLIEALLKLAKLDAGSVVFEKQQVDVKRLVESALEPLLIPMELKEQEIQLEIAEETQYPGDFAWSKEAVGNVLKNCVEHIGENGRIIVTGKENAIYTELCIEDNGEGIAAEDLPHLFERFYKGKHAGEQSVGIGLALARAIVTQQNGTIMAENARSGGARFVMRFYKSIV